MDYNVVQSDRPGNVYSMRVRFFALQQYLVSLLLFFFVYFSNYLSVYVVLCLINKIILGSCPELMI